MKNIAIYLAIGMLLLVIAGVATAHPVRDGCYVVDCESLLDRLDHCKSKRSCSAVESMVNIHCVGNWL